MVKVTVVKSGGERTVTEFSDWNAASSAQLGRGVNVLNLVKAGGEIHQLVDSFDGGWRIPVEGGSDSVSFASLPSAMRWIRAKHIAAAAFAAAMEEEF